MYRRAFGTSLTESIGGPDGLRVLLSRSERGSKMDRILNLFRVFPATFLSTAAPAFPRSKFDAAKRVISCALAAALVTVVTAPAAVQAGSTPLVERDAILRQSAVGLLPTAVGHPPSQTAGASSSFHLPVPVGFTVTAAPATPARPARATPGNTASQNDLGVPLIDECIVADEGGCDPTANRQYEDEDGNNVSRTCELRSEVYISLASVSVPIPPIFGVLPGFELVGVRMCDYGPRCGAEWNWEWFEMYD